MRFIHINVVILRKKLCLQRVKEKEEDKLSVWLEVIKQSSFCESCFEGGNEHRFRVAWALRCKSHKFIKILKITFSKSSKSHTNCTKKVWRKMLRYVWTELLIYMIDFWGFVTAGKQVLIKSLQEASPKFCWI